ncbi:Asp-tRNA(Asn)/Glu-tRNA(Gln) amidotransferase subunit GatC [Homoserinibacter sp. GY 40078]|uniref:Asp-tRNA(Asn)/Glu-tRNA(Gln) amidotransferase subunit GatC n=1 Tax=Homoserinibacter sp. GY 40078 TaxID=2603275 RepID=UPI0011CA8E43|nr:Asp-tRNA(Asn)/Glu-tRNA(Gln) amidotransferase subunit GatC [Homoserinibacter sp. GY 40078]
MSEITPEVVRHLAQLARIGIADDEVQRLTGELSQIVDAVATVRQVATEDVPATSHPIALGTVTRPDVVGTPLTPDEALAGAPERDGDFFKVTSILGEEQ